MSVIYLVLPLSMLLVLVAVLAYAWATRAGQLDDLETPAVRMLEDAERGGTGAPTPPLGRLDDDR